MPASKNDIDVLVLTKAALNFHPRWRVALRASG
jgi:hypothetical protein